MITQQQIEKTLANYPSTPNYHKDESARREWAKWRIILERIISNRHYHYNDPLKRPLLNMARFAIEMMGRANALVYGRDEQVKLYNMGCL